jgi:NAD(P)-dependent dehydrogenase (short-subunit alcohol dehydrogenase family)
MSAARLLAGKVALVTGGAAGIGRAIVRRFAAEGAAVALLDIDEAGAQTLAAEIEKGNGCSLPLRADVSRDEDVRRAVERTVARFGALHVLVNNAGVNVMKTAESATEADWARALDIDLKGVWLGCKHALPHLRAAGGGSIVNIASMHAFRTTRSAFPYAAAKGGVISLTRSLAVDHGRDRIRVNAICPGTIETNLSARWFDEQPDPSAARSRALGAIPLGRLGTPDDVAALAAFLASDQASFLSGTAIPVDGGRDALSAAGSV